MAKRLAQSPEMAEAVKEWGKAQTVSDFAEQVARHEGLKQQVNIAQIKEIMKVINRLLNGALYKLIRG